MGVQDMSVDLEKSMLIVPTTKVLQNIAIIPFQYRNIDYNERTFQTK